MPTRWSCMNSRTPLARSRITIGRPCGDSWVSELKSFINDGKTPIHFNLDGITDPVALARKGKGMDPIFDGHATAWELSLIQDNPSIWPRVTFYRNGVPDANPFAH